MLIALVVVWGSAFAAVKLAVESTPPVWVASTRIWIAVATLGAMMLAQGERLPRLTPRPDATWGWYAGVGVLGTLAPFFLFAFASESLPSAVVAIINGATPMFTALLAHLFIASERLTPRRAAGVALGFVGVAVLIGPAALAAFGPGAAIAAQLAAVLGAVGYAVGGVMTRSARPVPAVVGAFMFCACAGIAAVPASLLASGGSAPAWPGWPAALAILFLGVGPTGVASVGWVWLIKRRGPLFAAMATYLSPVWATLVGVALLGERPGWTAYAALGLILAGVLIASRPARAVVSSDAAKTH